MALGLDTAGTVNTGSLTLEDRLEALAAALADCRTGGDVVTLEAEWVRAKWRLRHPIYTATAHAMCEARRKELSREAAQASGGASAASGKED